MDLSGTETNCRNATNEELGTLKYMLYSDGTQRKDWELKGLGIESLIAFGTYWSVLTSPH